MTCLNPCCNGRGSKTSGEIVPTIIGLIVLILVVMEEGLRPFGLMPEVETVLVS